MKIVYIFGSGKGNTGMPVKGTYRKKEIYAGREILSRFSIYSINVYVI